MPGAIIARVVQVPPPAPPPLYRRRDMWLRAMGSTPLLGLTQASFMSFGAALLTTLFVVGCVAAAWYAAGQVARRDARRCRRPATVQAIYCANANGLEVLLPRHYPAAEDVERVFELGNLHTLGPSTADPNTVAFSRDRDEPWQYNEPRIHDAVAFQRYPPLLGQARLWFLHDGDHWSVKDGRDGLDSWQARRTPWRVL